MTPLYPAGVRAAPAPRERAARRRVLRGLLALPALAACAPARRPAGRTEPMPEAPQLIDAARADDLTAATGTTWRLVTDQVMGGVSQARVRRATVAGRPAVHLTGQVSLENNGGFVQTTLDLRPDGGAVDATGWTGLEITVLGNGESYNLHLRTGDVRRPWQSYRQSFPTTGAWQTRRLPFDGFEAHRIDAPLDLTRLKRIGLVAIGREFRADLAVADLRFYA
jgi:hypothetical protein